MFPPPILPMLMLVLYILLSFHIRMSSISSMKLISELGLKWNSNVCNIRDKWSNCSNRLCFRNIWSIRDIWSSRDKLSFKEKWKYKPNRSNRNRYNFSESCCINGN